MGSDCSRPGKAQGIIHANLERERSDRTDAWNRHKAAADRIVLNQLKHHSVQSFVAVEDRSPYVQHGLNHQREYWIAVLDQLRTRAS